MNLNATAADMFNYKELKKLRFIVIIHQLARAQYCVRLQMRDK